MKSQYNIFITRDILKEKKEITHTYILFYKTTIIYYLSLQIKKSVCYINRLDTTGYIKKCKSKDFVYTILFKYIKCNLIYCLSKSTPYFVFKNENKNILTNDKLIYLWKNIFSQFNDSNVQIINTQSQENCLDRIFENLCIFKDDPISKILSHKLKLNSKKLFKILCCRSDFIESSYVFLLRNNKYEKNEKENFNLSIDNINLIDDNITNKNIEFEIYNNLENANLKNEDIKIKNKCVNIIKKTNNFEYKIENNKSLENDRNNIYDYGIENKYDFNILNLDDLDEYLLSLNFSDDINIEKSSLKFIKKFNVKLNPFTLFKCKQFNNKQKEDFITIKCKRIK